MKRIGLLPLHLELYDETCAYMRPKIEQFRDTIIELLEANGLRIVCAPICRLQAEFLSAIKQLEQQDVCALITLHLAYSPSLESIKALTETDLPLIVLDTSMSDTFNESTSSDEILYNHGIHGVQDMCNMLRRNGKQFQIFAGHYESSDVLLRVTRHCRGIQAAAEFQKAQVGLVGKPFRGMGDFIVPFDQLKNRFGIEVIHYDMQAGEKAIASITNEEISKERKIDKLDFDWDDSVTEELYENTVKVCLALRKWAAKQKITALTVNFMETQGSNPGLPIMPFTECSKAMVRGIGYAGEGDVLTAALCGSLLQLHDETSFAEMFCPDWKGNSVFLSHMGEFNYRISRTKPVLTEKDFPFTSAKNPTVAYATFKSGQVMMINLAPGPNDTYTLIVSPGQMLDVSVGKELKNSVNGWFRPNRPLQEFLEEFSLAGGTHHSVLVYADCLDEMRSFAQSLDMEFKII